MACECFFYKCSLYELEQPKYLLFKVKAQYFTRGQADRSHQCGRRGGDGAQQG